MYVIPLTNRLSMKDTIEDYATQALDEFFRGFKIPPQYSSQLLLRYDTDFSFKLILVDPDTFPAIVSELRKIAEGDSAYFVKRVAAAVAYVFDKDQHIVQDLIAAMGDFVVPGKFFAAKVIGAIEYELLQSDHATHSGRSICIKMISSVIDAACDDN